jgi:hypothetical protein
MLSGVLLKALVRLDRARGAVAAGCHVELGAHKKADCSCAAVARVLAHVALLLGLEVRLVALKALVLLFAEIGLALRRGEREKREERERGKGVSR